MANCEPVHHGPPTSNSAEFSRADFKDVPVAASYFEFGDVNIKQSMIYCV
jgi:hypothetical protein